MDAILRCCRATVLALIAAGNGAGNAQPLWQPHRHVELIVPSAAGGGLDRTARTVHRIWQDHRLVAAPNAVVNKPGGAGTISYTYLNQFTGDAHYISVSSPTLLTNHILGTSRLAHTDFTPLAQLSSEYLMLLVKGDSPLISAKDVFDRLKKDPGALSIAIGSVPGGSNHLGIARVMKAAGIDVRRLKTVVFKSGTESTLALLGGHIDLSANAPEQILRHMDGGKLRAIAIGAPRRLPGALAAIPTWKELGIDVVADTWRGMVGPKGLAPAQIAYWDGVFGKLAQSREWREEIEKHHWLDTYRDSAGSRRFLEADYQVLKSALTDLGLVKQ
jgi:putative tricarboxylic transport membrane protein